MALSYAMNLANGSHMYDVITAARPPMIARRTTRVGALARFIPTNSSTRIVIAIM